MRIAQSLKPCTMHEHEHHVSWTTHHHWCFMHTYTCANKCQQLPYLHVVLAEYSVASIICFLDGLVGLGLAHRHQAWLRHIHHTCMVMVCVGTYVKQTPLVDMDCRVCYRWMRRACMRYACPPGLCGTCVMMQPRRVTRHPSVRPRPASGRPTWMQRNE